MKKRLLLFMFAVSILVHPIHTYAFSFLDYFSEEDEVGEYNNEQVLKEALDKNIELLQEAYIGAQYEIANEYILKENGYLGSFLFGILTDIGVDTDDLGLMGDYDVALTRRSIEIAMEESGSMDYAFIISALSLLEEFRYGNSTYADLKEYISSESVKKHLCNYHTEERYGILNSDGSITDCEDDTTGGKLYLKTYMRACTVENVFYMLGLSPDAYSDELPNMTNYEVVVMRKNALKNTFATYYDFGMAEIDYTITNNYKTALMSDLTYMDAGMNIPIYHQEDYPESPYGSSNVAASGCGPTSMAMITTFMTGNVVTPDIIASLYSQYYVNGKGSSHQLFFSVAEDYGFCCKQLKMNAQEIINELDNRHPVIITVGKGKFTKGGHIMVIRGITSDGYFLLNDPNGYNLEKFDTDAFTINDVMLNAQNGHAYAFYYVGEENE